MCCEISVKIDEDIQLLRAWRGGDRRAADRLYLRHAPEVRRFFLRAAPEHGADLVQDTFAALLRRTAGEPASVRGYVMAIARNVLCRYLRRRYKHRRECGDYRMVCVPESRDWTPAAALESGERRAALAEAFARCLTDAERELLRLRHGEGLSVEETARRLGISRTAFPGRAMRARQRWRDGLPPELLGGGRGRTGAGEDPARDLG